MLQYPVLLVHGLGVPSHNLESSRLWGDIPERLREEGISVWFSTQDALGGVESCARQVANSFHLALKRAGADKMHVVAHSKGGLDIRVALAMDKDVADHTFSLVTLATPHHGLHYVDRLGRSRVFWPHIAAPVLNGLARLSGDRAPSGVQILHDLSTDGTQCLAQRYPWRDSIPCYSYGFIVPPAHGIRRLDAFRAGVTRYDGENDGLVPLWSTQFGRWVLVDVEDVRTFTHIDASDRHRRHARFVLSDGREYFSVPDLVADTLRIIETEQV